MFDFLQPAATWLIEKIPQRIGSVLLPVIIALTAADLVYTVITTINFRKQLEALYEFRKEVEFMLQDLKGISLKEFLAGTTKELSENGALEERFHSYVESCSRFLKKMPLLGNQRLVDAFPTMKIITKSRSSVAVREVFINLKKVRGKKTQD
jgi:uncharacterized membrane protein